MPVPAFYPVASLEANVDNPRFPAPVESEREAIIQIARIEGPKLIALAREISQIGWDGGNLPLIVQHPEDDRLYTVMEGNRRLAALRILQNPELLRSISASTVASYRRIPRERPLPDEVQCMYYLDEENELLKRHIEVRHLGEQNGVGVSRWESQEQARFGSSDNTLADQAVKFVERAAGQNQRRPSYTTLTRLLGTPRVREVLGLKLKLKRLYAEFPPAQVAERIIRVLDDLEGKNRRPRLSVDAFRTLDQRNGYAEDVSVQLSLLEQDRLAVPLLLNDIDDLTTVPGNPQPSPGPQPNANPNPSPNPGPNPGPGPGPNPGPGPGPNTAPGPNPGPPPRSRTVLVPTSFRPTITVPRLGKLLDEMRKLKVSEYPNLASMTLRVMTEGVVDDYRAQVMLQNNERKPLPDKINLVIAHLQTQGKLTPQESAGYNGFATDRTVGEFNVETLHKYLHNPYIPTSPGSIIGFWDQLQPLVAKILAHQEEERVARGGQRR